MSKSLKRVRATLEAAGVTPEIRETALARTAVDAATALDCAVDQIAKSIVLRGEDSAAALLFTPIVLAYQGWTYWVFRRRISTDRPTQRIAGGSSSPAAMSAAIRPSVVSSTFSSGVVAEQTTAQGSSAGRPAARREAAICSTCFMPM